MQSHYLSYNNSTIHYLQFGSGSKLLCCFHGYDKDSFSFLFLEKLLGEQYTIIAIDAPYHGKTKWKEGFVENAGFVLPILKKVKDTIHIEGDKLTILGFSMGGRMALSLVQLIPEKVERLVLIASDGFDFNFWRWLLTDTFLAKILMAHVIINPTWALGLIKKAEKFWLIKMKLSTFLTLQLSDEEKRKRLYDQVVSNRKLKPSTTEIKQLIKEYFIEVRMMFGEEDQIVPAKNTIHFQKKLGETVKVKWVKAGHNLLNETQAQNIMDLFSQ